MKSMIWFESLAALLRSATGTRCVEIRVQTDPPIQATAADGFDDTAFNPATWIEPSLVDPQAAGPEFAMSEWVASAAAAPIVGPSAEVGWIVAAHDQPNYLSPSSVRLLEDAASFAERHLDASTEAGELDALSEKLHYSEVELRETKARLEVSNQELEQFAYIAAHELVAPLRSVAVYAEVLGAIVDDTASAQVADCVTEIRSGVQTMTEQVQYLLTLSRANQQARELELIDPVRCARDAIDTIEELLESADGQITVGEIPSVRGHHVALQSVFANLFTNAIRYRDHERDLVVSIDGSQSQDRVIIEVRDTGSGISEEAQGRIFALFERDSTSTDGLGVGLAVSRRILEGFGATIRAQNNDAGGATFVLDFPVPANDVD